MDLVGQTPPAPDHQWIGPDGGDWQNASNWSAGTIPGPGDRVQIRGGSVVLTGWAEIDALDLSDAAALLVDGGELKVADLYQGVGAGGADITLRSATVETARWRAEAGSITVESSTVRAGGADTRIETSTGLPVTVASGELTVDTRNFDVLWEPPLEGNGGLTKVGAGTLTFTAPATLADGFDIQAGTLDVGARGKELENLPVDVRSGARFAGSGAFAGEYLEFYAEGGAIFSPGPGIATIEFTNQQEWPSSVNGSTVFPPEDGPVYELDLGTPGISAGDSDYLYFSVGPPNRDYVIMPTTLDLRAADGFGTGVYRVGRVFGREIFFFGPKSHGFYVRSAPSGFFADAALVTGPSPEGTQTDFVEVTVTEAGLIVTGTESAATDSDLGPAGSPLSFEGGTLQVNGSFTVGRNIFVHNGTTNIIEVADGEELKITGAIRGGGTLLKRGEGTLYITADQERFFGEFRVEGGTLAVNEGILPRRGRPGPRPALTLDGGTLSIRSGSGNQAFGWIELGPDGGTLDIPAGVARTLSADIRGDGTFRKTGDGSLEFRIDANFDGLVHEGSIVVEDGTLNLTTLDGTPLPDPPFYDIAEGGTLSLASNQSGETVLPQEFRGTGTLRFLPNPDAAFRLTGESSFSGSVEVGSSSGDVIDEVTLRIGADDGTGSFHASRYFSLSRSYIQWYLDQDLVLKGLAETDNTFLVFENWGDATFLVPEDLELFHNTAWFRLYNGGLEVNRLGSEWLYIEQYNNIPISGDGNSIVTHRVGPDGWFFSPGRNGGDDVGTLGFAYWGSGFDNHGTIYFDLNRPGIVGGEENDLIEVFDKFVLNTTTLVIRPGPGFGPGTYELFRAVPGSQDQAIFLDGGGDIVIQGVPVAFETALEHGPPEDDPFFKYVRLHVTLPAYERWADAHGLTGDDRALDAVTGPGDITNRLRFFLGIGPETDPFPHLPVSGSHEESGVTYFEFTTRLNAEALPLNPTVWYARENLEHFQKAVDGVDGVIHLHEPDYYEAGVDRLRVRIPMNGSRSVFAFLGTPADS